MKRVRLSSSVRRGLWIGIGVVLVYTLAGFFLVPRILKNQLEKRLSAELGRLVTVEKVRFNPYALSVTLENFDVRTADMKNRFLGWTRLYVNFEALASIPREWVLGEIALEGFYGEVVVRRDGSLSFADILAKLSAKETPSETTPAKPVRPVLIRSLEVSRAQVEFADESHAQPFKTTIGPLTFVVKGFRTAPGDSGAPYHFEAVTEAGERLAWAGTLAAMPFRSAGELRLENIQLAKYSPYYAERIQADLVEGRLTMRGRYDLNLSEENRVLKLLDGALQLRGIKVVERADRAIALELPELDITGVHADGVAMQGVVESIRVSGGHIHARREKDGSINLVNLLQPAPTVAALPPPVTTITPPAPALTAGVSAPGKLPDVKIGELALKGFRVDFKDLAAPRPANLALSDLNFSIKQVTLADGATMPLELAFGFAPQGTVSVTGEVSIKPELKADMKLAVTSLALLPLSPYGEEFVNARITQGSVTTTLAAQFALSAGGAPTLTLGGDVSLENFGLVDGTRNEALAGFRSLALKGIQVTNVPQLTVTLGEVNVAAPYARVIVNEDKSLNLAAVAKPAAPSSPANAAIVETKPPASSAAAALEPKIEIAKVVISEGDFRVMDRSVEPHVLVSLGQFGGTIAGLSSANLARAEVDLRGAVDGAGPVAITGKLDPLGAKKSVDLKVDFKNVDLVPLSPYSGKFAGYELARGKLMLDVKFLLDDRKIDATNVVTLNQFTFGQSVKSPDATSLPVRLGVALLKDMDGRIVIDVPVQGSLDDPNFRIGRVVLRVVVNLLTKAAVSPFSLLGSMFGGGGEELAFQEFAPGQAGLQAAELKKLETLVKALQNRPGLSLALEGSFDTAADRHALKQVRLTETVRRAVWESRRAADPNILPPEQLEITAEEQAATVKKLFDEKFPPGTEFGAPLPPAPVVVAPPEKPKPGFFKRVVNVVTFKSAREERAARQENERAVEAQANVSAATAAGIDAGLSLEEMSGRLAEAIEVTDNDLRALAQTREQQVRDYFVTTGKIDPERLFLSKSTSPANEGKGPRVFLSLQ